MRQRTKILYIIALTLFAAVSFELLTQYDFEEEEEMDIVLGLTDNVHEWVDHDGNKLIFAERALSEIGGEHVSLSSNASL
ncbi:MAG: hypothetical protein LBE48_02715 [Methanomassiliicoccaceae archaeon]|jgi:hypothetical protein|nr:hypothetical protein [Methanomassiliicoccaceae archaeon]